jgi:hypothetical protein
MCYLFQYVKDNEADELAVCDEIKVIPSPALTCANAVILATEASLIPAGKITPPVVMLFAADSSNNSHYVNLKYLIDISALVVGAVVNVKVVPDIV